MRNEITEEEIDQLKAKRGLAIGLNEERRVNQLKINIDDVARKTTLMETEVENIVERWQSKIAVVKKGIEEDQIRNQQLMLGQLVEKYISQIFERNKKMVDLIRVKEDIESKI